MQGTQEGTLLARDSEVLEDKEAELEPSKLELKIFLKVCGTG